MEKKKSGNDYLKEKIAKLTDELAKSQDQVTILCNENAKQKADYAKLKHEYDNEIFEHQALEKKYVDLQGIVDKQKTTISKQTAEIKRLESVSDENAKKVGAIMDEIMDFMGPIRRWLFRIKHKEGVL